MVARTSARASVHVCKRLLDQERRRERKQKHNAIRPRYRHFQGDNEHGALLDIVKDLLQVHFLAVEPFPSKARRDDIIKVKYDDAKGTCHIHADRYPLGKPVLRLVRL